MRTSILSACLFAALAAGCTGSGSGSVVYSGEVSTPELIEISPGVQVIADYDEPVFYSDNYYWRYDAGVWYRSGNYRRDWVRIEAPPERVRRIDRPTAYIHYRAGARAEVRDRDHRDYQPPPQPAPGPVVRDHRDYQPPPQPTPPPPPPAPTPVVRDHRDLDEKAERHEMKEERRDERKDAKEERKDARKDAKEERKEEKRERKEDKKEDHRHH